jgi:hypothetical protein
MIAIGLLFVRLLCDYFRPRGRDVLQARRVNSSKADGGTRR